MVSVIREGVCCVWIHEKKTNRVRKSEICGSRRFKRAKRVGEQTESLRTRLVFLHVSKLTHLPSELE